MASTADLELEKRVIVSRDEAAHPSRGTWPKFRGLKGTIIEIVKDRRPRLTEYGVQFKKDEEPFWFLRHELELT